MSDYIAVNRTVDRLTALVVTMLRKNNIDAIDKDDIIFISRVIRGCVRKSELSASDWRDFKPLGDWACEACRQSNKIENGGMFPIWRDNRTAYVHTECAHHALSNGWNEGHHNLIKMSHDAWLVFWRGECAEVKTRKQAKELLKQLNEGDSTKRGGTR